jgi:hypothetical protein
LHYQRDAVNDPSLMLPVRGRSALKSLTVLARADEVIE